MGEAGHRAPWNSDRQLSTVTSGDPEYPPAREEEASPRLLNRRPGLPATQDPGNRTAK